MRDPNKDPNIYGNDAYGARVVRDKYLVDRGSSSQVQTYGGQNYARQVAAQKKLTQSNALPSSPTFYNPPSPSAGGRSLLQDLSPQSSSTGRRSFGGSGMSRDATLNALAGVAGAIGAVFAAAHGVTTGVGMAISFVIVFVASRIVLQYFKQLAGLAVVAFGLYAIVHYFVGH